MTIKTLAAICTLLLVNLCAQAKTLHVAKWGIDDPESGSTSQPFASIGAALMNAGNNDRIVVQPGIYTEALIIEWEGIKLESVAGRHGTVIDNTGGSEPTVDIRASKVRLGKKNKGFTLRCATGESGVILNPVYDLAGVRVEYNRLVGCGDDGIHISGEKALVRGNWIESTGYAVYCIQCVKAVIQDNVVLPGSDGFVLESVVNTTIMGNLLLGSEGISMGDDSEGSKLKDNVVVEIDTTTPGIEVQSTSSSGALVQGNIVANSMSNGIEISQNVANEKDVQIKNNLAFDHDQTGLRVQKVGSGDPASRSVIDGNTLIQSFTGVELVQGVNIKSFKGNNTYANEGSGANGIGVFSDNGFDYRKHFWGKPFGGAADGPDSDGGMDTHDSLVFTGDPVEGSDAGKPNPVKAKKAAGL